MKKVLKKVIRKIIGKKNYNKIRNNRRAITNSKKLKKLKNNKFVGVLPTLENSKIIFEGKNNILYCEEGVSFVNSVVKFSGNNSLIYLSKNTRYNELILAINYNMVCYFGEHIYINNKLWITLAEEKNLFVGNDCLFAPNVIIRNADAHLIYDSSTKKRLNLTKSIFIGDHVWIGQNSFILKGTKIGSGSIIAAGSTVAGKKISSNETWGGNPAKKIKENIFWERPCVHQWTEEKTNDSSIHDTKEFIFNGKDDNFDILEDNLSKLDNANDKLNYLIDFNKKDNKNRFSIK